MILRNCIYYCVLLWLLMINTDIAIPSYIPVIENGIEKMHKVATPVILVEGYREFRDHPGRWYRRDNFGLKCAEDLVPWLKQQGVPAYSPYWDNKPEFGNDEQKCRLKCSFLLIGPEKDDEKNVEKPEEIFQVWLLTLLVGALMIVLY